MELSPLARKRLEKLGELSEEEKLKIKFSEKLSSLLSEYFTGRVNLEELWGRMRAFKEEGKGFLIKEAQKKLLEAIRMEDSDPDLRRKREALLALETLKEESRHNELEPNLNQLDRLRKSYKEEKEKFFESLKRKMQSKVELAAQQLTRQGKPVNVEGSVEANVRTSSEWRNFLARHERTYGEKFKALIAQLRELI